MTTSYSEQPAAQAQPGEAGEPTVLVAPEALEALLTPQSFPTPSLIPPDIVRRRAVGNAKRRTGLALVLVLAIIAVFYVIGRMEVATARIDLATAQAGLRAAEAQRAEYKDIPAVFAAVDAARAELAQAMGNEVQVARLITDLSLIVPPGVSLTSVSMVTGGEELQGAMENSAGNEVQELPVGSVTFSGEASRFNDVSAWVDTLRAQSDYQNVILTDVSRVAGTGLYIFSCSAELTEEALSGRFVQEQQ